MEIKKLIKSRGDEKFLSDCSRKFDVFWERNTRYVILHQSTQNISGMERFKRVARVVAALVLTLFLILLAKGAREKMKQMVWDSTDEVITAVPLDQLNREDFENTEADKLARFFVNSLLSPKEKQDFWCLMKPGRAYDVYMKAKGSGPRQFSFFTREQLESLNESQLKELYSNEVFNNFDVLIIFLNKLSAIDIRSNADGSFCSHYKTRLISQSNLNKLSIETLNKIVPLLSEVQLNAIDSVNMKTILDQIFKNSSDHNNLLPYSDFFVFLKGKFLELNDNEFEHVSEQLVVKFYPFITLDDLSATRLQILRRKLPGDKYTELDRVIQSKDKEASDRCVDSAGIPNLTARDLSQSTATASPVLPLVSAQVSLQGLPIQPLSQNESSNISKIVFPPLDPPVSPPQRQIPDVFQKLHEQFLGHKKEFHDLHNTFLANVNRFSELLKSPPKMQIDEITNLFDKIKNTPRNLFSSWLNAQALNSTNQSESKDLAEMGNLYLKSQEILRTLEKQVRNQDVSY